MTSTSVPVKNVPSVEKRTKPPPPPTPPPQARDASGSSGTITKMKENKREKRGACRRLETKEPDSDDSGEGLGWGGDSHLSPAGYTVLS